MHSLPSYNEVTEVTEVTESGLSPYFMQDVAKVTFIRRRIDYLCTSAEP